MFALLAIALGLGLVGGVVARGRVSNLREVHLSGAPLLFASVVVALTPLFVNIPRMPRQIMQIVAMLGVLAFCALNIAASRGWVRAGFGIVLLGWLLNFVAVASNGGMPLSRWAWARAGVRDTVTPGKGGFFKIVWAHPGSWFKPLGDAIPVRALGQVVSIGDVLLMAGIAFVIAAAMRAPARDARARRAVASRA